MDKFIRLFEGILQPLSCVIFFALEVWVIFSFFSDLPDHGKSYIFWQASALVVTSFHLFLIINLKTQIKNKSLYIIPLALVYLLIIGIFFLSSLAFTLKSVENKSYGEDIKGNRNQQIIKTINYNNLAIDKYNEIVSTTNDIKVIMRFRNEINKLSATNGILSGELITTTNSGIQQDSFKLLSDRIGLSRSMLIFWFLISLWILFEIGLFMTAPILDDIKNISKSINNNQLNIVYEDKLKRIIRQNKELLLKFIDEIFEDKRIRSDKIISLRGNISFKNCRECRKILNHYKHNGMTLLQTRKGAVYPNFSKAEMIDIISNV